MGFKLPGGLSKIVQIAAPALGFALGGPIGASIGGVIGGGLGAMDASRAAKDAQNQANAFTAQQQAALNQAGALGQAQSEKEIAAINANKTGNLSLLQNQLANQQALHDDQVVKTQEQERWVQEQLNAAKAAGDQAAQQRLTTQLSQIQENLTTLKTEAQNLAAQNKATLDAAQAKETGLIQGDITSNKALQAEYGAANDKAQGDLSRYQANAEDLYAQQRKMADQVATWKAAALSDMDSKYRDLEENERRMSAQKGQQTPKGVSLAISLAKARDKGALKASLDKQEMDWKAQNLATASNMNAGLSGYATTAEALAARKAAGLEQTSGQQLANLSRYYSNAMLGQDTAAGNVGINAVQRAGELTLNAKDANQLSLADNTQNLYAGTMQNKLAGNAALANLDTGMTNAKNANISDQMALNDTTMKNMSSAQRYGVDAQKFALTGNAAIYGTGAANALDAAKQSNATAGSFLAGMGSAALDIGKWVNNKYGSTSPAPATPPISAGFSSPVPGKSADDIKNSGFKLGW